MIEAIRKTLALLDAREKRRGVLLMGVLIIAGLAEVMGLSAFMGLLLLLAQPETAQKNEILSAIYTFLNFETLQSFQIFAACGVAVTIILGLIIKAGSLLAVQRFVAYAGHNLSARLLRAYLAQSYIWSLDKKTVEISRKVLAECQLFVTQVARPLLSILASCVLAASIIGFLLVVEPVIALLSFTLLGGGYGLTYLLLRNPLKRLGDTLVRTNKERFRVLLEAVSGLKDIKLVGLEDIYSAEYNKASLKRTRTAISMQMFATLPRFVLEGLTFTILLLVVFILLLRNDGDLLAAIPTLGIFAFAVMRLLPALQQVYHGFASLRSGLAVLDTVHEDYIAVKAAEQPPLRSDRRSRHPLTRSLVFDQVSFSYPTAEKTALEDLSVKIKANTSVGIVGGTGAGKTTFVDLLLCLLTPDEGQISVDDVPLTKQNARAWQNTIGYVPQQIFLINDSIAANIALGVARDAVDMTAVHRAAKIAALHDFVVEELPDGYDTMIGERGSRLSGGQRQRIGIARALYHDPSVLIFDEATSALDNITEGVVMQAMQNLQNQKTIIMIAHRLTTVEDCDKILLMDKGRVLATGTYTELAAKNSLFQRMIGKKSVDAA